MPPALSLLRETSIPSAMGPVFFPGLDLPFILSSVTEPAHKDLCPLMHSCAGTLLPLSLPCDQVEGAGVGCPYAGYISRALTGA